MTSENNNGYGYMIVRVTTARGAIPIEGALVSVNNYDPEFESGRGDVIAMYTSGASGLTERFALPAPPRSLSMSPGSSSAAPASSRRSAASSPAAMLVSTAHSVQSSALRAQSR